MNTKRFRTMLQGAASGWLVVTLFALSLSISECGSSAPITCSDKLPVIEPILEETVAGVEVYRFTTETACLWRHEVLHNDGPAPKELSEYLSLRRIPGNNSYVMKLEKPLHVEEIHSIIPSFTGTFLLRFFCSCGDSNEKSQDQLFEVETKNEYPPEFNTSLIEVDVKENTPVGTAVISLADWASDDDYEFEDFPLRHTFDMESTDTSKQFFTMDRGTGKVKVSGELDYEALDREYTVGLSYHVYITDSGGLKGSAVLLVYIMDEDDQPPRFYYEGCPQPCNPIYKARVDPGYTGPLVLSPAPLLAKDGDSLEADVTYHLVDGPEGFRDYVFIDERTGNLILLKDLEKFLQGRNAINLEVEAREVSENARVSERRKIRLGIWQTVVKASALEAPTTDDLAALPGITLVACAFFLVSAALAAVLSVAWKKRAQCARG